MAQIISGLSTGDLFDGVLTGVVKFASEEFLKPYIGNGTIMSGGIKLVAGTLVKSQIKGKIGKIVGDAWQIDGTEDLAYFVYTKFLNRSTGSGNSNSAGEAVL